MLGRYGIKGKEAASALMLMSTLGTVRHGSDALNLDTDIDAILGEEEKKETPAAPVESVDALKAEIKRLRAALHASDKENRETKKSLNRRHLREAGRKRLAKRSLLLRTR